MTRGLVLDPRGTPAQKAPREQPSAGDTKIESLRIGIRHDGAWRSWDCVSKEWAGRLGDMGALVHFWRSGCRVGDEAERLEREQQQFYDASDVVICGLCNCGSCTMQTVHDAVGALERAIPAVVVSTGHFEPLAHRLASDLGWPDLPVVNMPFALESRSIDDVRVIADESFGTLLEVLGSKAC
jgi:hypothetical protein